jgi:hypothetical protein
MSRVVIALLLALALGLPPGASAQTQPQPSSPIASLRAQLRVASFHARELAQRAGNSQLALLHTHHVMNCLEGPRGPNFNQASGYPCQGQGAGILEDLKTAQAAGAPGTEAAAKQIVIAYELIKQSLRHRDLDDVQAWTKKSGELLSEALRAIGE